MQQQVGLVDFFQRGFERLHEVVGQLADESHRVGQQAKLMVGQL